MPFHKYTFTKPLPPGVDSQTAVQLLHNPFNIFSLSDIIIGHRKISEDLTSRKASYEITDAVSYLPFGLWEGTVSVQMDFVFECDGLSITKHAPMGITIRERWRVLTGETEARGKGMKLEAELEAGRPQLVLFSRMMERNHERYLGQMVEKAGWGGT
ncbi:hypothetical protein MFIFM68171_09573 [Madurella fahalii]|uniref:DUF7053 domain-containing protein n=1 Tax=Madurella fahalii TaxID=1157608 RepID=A0ABQ0GNL3_9PEZI